MAILFRILLVLAALCQGFPQSNNHIVHEKRNDETTQWVKRGRLDRNHLLPMRIGLRQCNLENGYDMLMAVSDPSSKNFGKYYTQDEVIKAFAPSDETVQAVHRWLTSSGIHEQRITHSDNKGWLAFHATVEEAENLLKARFHEFEHSDLGKRAAATDEYSLPAHIKHHVDYITPGVKLGTFRKRKSFLRTKSAEHGASMEHLHQNSKKFYAKTASDMGIKEGVDTIIADKLKHCDRRATPECIRALYDIPLPEYSTPNPNNTLGVYEFGDYYTQRDLNLFFENQYPSIPQGTHPKPAFIDGAKAPYKPDFTSSSESDLDFELIYPLIYPQQTTLYQTDDPYYAIESDVYGIFNDFLDAIDGSYCTYTYKNETGNDPTYDPKYPDKHKHGYKGKLQCGVYKPTNVISVSYGVAEFNLPNNYQMRQCNEFMKLGLQGVTVIIATGDTGVATSEGCIGKDQSVFAPTYPNNCYAVTAVGATKIAHGNTVYDREVAAIQRYYNFSSSGGFSNIFSRPHYQDAVVSEYFAKHDPGYPFYSGDFTTPSTDGRYNRNGRGYPDVSAIGDNILTYTYGGRYINGGTSASAPIFASMINRINEKRLAAGKSTVGFINPTLYANPDMFTDIVEGNNPGCKSDGFYAVKGWDPVTGLGTPIYPKLMKVFMALP